MFKRFAVDDYVTLDVADYLTKATTVVGDKLIEKYTDKVLENVGLIILVEDFVIKSPPKISNTDCSALYSVKVYLLCFAPDNGESFNARVIESNESGLTVSVGFFDDIRILAAYLKPSYIFNAKSNIWSKGGKRGHVEIGINNMLKCKVVEVIYNKLKGKRGKDDANISPIMLIIANIDE